MQALSGKITISNSSCYKEFGGDKIWVTFIGDVGEHSPSGRRVVKVAIPEAMIMNRKGELHTAVRKIYRLRPEVSASSLSIASQIANCKLMA